MYGHGVRGGGQGEARRHEVTATFYEALVFPPVPMPGTAGVTTQARVFKSWIGHAGDIGGVSIYRGSNLLKRYGVPHPYPLPSLWRSSHQEFSWADSQPYGIPIYVQFL